MKRRLSNELAPMRIMRIAEVTELLGVSRATIYGWRNTRDFPAPVKLGVRAGGWHRKTVEDWLATRIAA